MSVAEPPSFTSHLKTEFQRAYYIQQPHTWTKAHYEAMLQLKLGNAEFRDLPHHNDQYETVWPDWRYNTGKLTKTLMKVDQHNGTVEKDGIVTGIQYKDWNSVLNVNSNVNGGFSQDVVTTIYWSAGADAVVWLIAKQN